MKQVILTKKVHSTVLELLAERAVKSGDGFRQWLYDADYEIQDTAYLEVVCLMLIGLSAQDIADTLYKEHA